MKKSELKSTVLLILMYAAIIAVMIIIMPIDNRNQLRRQYGKLAYNAEVDGRAKFIIDNYSLYPQKLIDMYYSDPEKRLDFVYNYAFHGNDYQNMSFTDEELNSKTVPALYMSDFRWCYEKYADNYIFTGGCTAVSVTMAALYLGKTDVDPVKVGKYAEENGFVGTFIGGILNKNVSDVLAGMGLECREHIYEENDENREELSEEFLRSAIDDPETVVLAAMSGDTFGPHMIVLRGYDEKGYYINDPASPENTGAVWSFDIFRSETERMYEVFKKI